MLKLLIEITRWTKKKSFSLIQAIDCSQIILALKTNKKQIGVH